LEKETDGSPGKLTAVPLDITQDESVIKAYKFVKEHLQPGQSRFIIF
jgi:hypothetical protein